MEVVKHSSTLIWFEYVKSMGIKGDKVISKCGVDAVVVKKNPYIIERQTVGILERKERWIMGGMSVQEQCMDRSKC